MGKMKKDTVKGKVEVGGSNFRGSKCYKPFILALCGCLVLFGFFVNVT